jgi:4-amino-4-deoxy-L-arabinose transferase-like glycosyltransferase
MKSPFERIDELKDSRVIIIIMIVTAVAYLMLINADPLPDIMEARNLVAARECVDDGNCFVPTMNGEPRVRKPPLPTWVTAGTMALFGTTKSIYAARAPVVILIALAALFVYLTARRWMTKSLATAAALIMVSFVVMESEARRVTWDIFTTTFAFGGVYGLLHAMSPRPPNLGKETNPWRWIILSIILWSLAILSKGPLPVYSVFVPFTLAMVLRRERKDFRWWAPVVVIIIGVAVGTSWWGYIYMAHPEIVSKLSGEAASWTSKHSNGPLYYLIRLPILIFPWALLLLASFILPYVKGTDGRAMLDHEKQGQIKFFLIWLALSFILLSLAPQKKYRYLMGMLMPASFAIAFLIGEIREKGAGGLPSSLSALWTLHKIQIPLAALGLAGLAIYSVTNLGTPAWILVFILPLAGLLYCSIRHWKSVSHTALVTVFLMVVTPFIFGLNSRDYITRGQGGALELSEALSVAEETCNQTLYAFREDIEIVWITGRTNIPIKKDTVLGKLPALVLVDSRDEANFNRWAASKELTFYEISSFRYKEELTIYRIKKAG